MKMKHLTLSLLVLCCGILQAQRKPKIKGNRAVIDVHEELPPFNSIELIDDLDIYLEKSPDQGYSITADDNLIDVLKFKVEDNTLIISSFYKITTKKKLDITVRFQELSTVTLREGVIKMEDIVTTDELRVNTYGNSRLQLNASAAVTHINMEGISSGDFNLDTDSLDVNLKDRVDASIYVVGGKNNVRMLKNASLSMEGTTDTLHLNLLESAKFKGKAFEAAVVHATLEETSSARIYAYRDLELSSKGSAKTYLYGDPKISLIEFLDTSELYKRKD